ncbi:hypothetical protein M885DRAFT_610084 [Pelagophyceae sp. CCMP2097]|nr:hypothetical protein M885DRAFT_610084 [Pelagophyceae sp. CCMP2097]
MPCRWLLAAAAAWVSSARRIEAHAGGAPEPKLEPRLDATCYTWLEKKGLLHLAQEDATCPLRGETSPLPLVLGAGLGGTATRSVAAAVRALGVPTCHESKWLGRGLEEEGLAVLGRSGAWFDDPMGGVWPRALCRYPNAKIILTVRAGYHREYADGTPKCPRNANGTLDVNRYVKTSRCLTYGVVCPDLEQAAHAYHRGVRRVLAQVPKHKLLVVNISAGLTWTPLAAFLSRPAPSGAFPRSETHFCDKTGRDTATMRRTTVPPPDRLSTTRSI